MVIKARIGNYQFEATSCFTIKIKYWQSWSWEVGIEAKAEIVWNEILEDYSIDIKNEKLFDCENSSKLRIVEYNIKVKEKGRVRSAAIQQ